MTWPPVPTIFLHRPDSRICRRWQELRKLLSNVYAGKTAFPVDIGVPYLADNLLACETVHECYTTLKNSLRQASDAPGARLRVCSSSAWSGLVVVVSEICFLGHGDALRW